MKKKKLDLITKKNKDLIPIPEDVTCIHPYVLTGAITVSTGIVLFLIKRLRERELELKQNINNYIQELKDQNKNLYTISDKKTNLVLQNLENQLAKIEVVLSKI